MPHGPTADRDVLPMLPRPINYQYLHRVVAGRPETTIARTWLLRDAARCTLCHPRHCTASPADPDRKIETAMCLHVVEGAHVPESEVELFRVGAHVARPGEADGRPGASTG